MGADKKKAPPRLGPKRERRDDDELAPVEDQGSLFEHFGVEPRAPARGSAAVVEGQRCRGCAWLVREQDGHACPLCHTPLVVDPRSSR